jgi:hypothetical protein
MPAPVFGTAVVDAAFPFPDTSISITRGASDNCAIGGGYGDAGGQTAAYGADAATLIGAEVTFGTPSFTARMFHRINPASGAQDWTLTGGGTPFGPAVMTFAGVDTAAPVRGAVQDAALSAVEAVITLDTLTADEITVAYVAWNAAGSGSSIAATGATTIRGQTSNAAGFGVALLTSTTNVISFNRTFGGNYRVSAAILTGSSGGGGGGGPTIARRGFTIRPVRRG